MPATQSSPVQTSSHPVSDPKLAVLYGTELLVNHQLGTLTLLLLHDLCELSKSILCGELYVSYDINNLQNLTV